MTTIEAKTGSDVLREAIAGRVRNNLRYAGIARDLGIAPNSLERFAENKLTFPPETLDAIAKEIFGSNVRYDADRRNRRALRRSRMIRRATTDTTRP